ncbi:MAG: hypothetical protein AAF485_04280, partial [Chloroflexota bacterium]
MIIGYSPRYIDTTSALIEAAESLLCPCIGKKLEANWIGWMNEHECWWEDMPVILQIGHDRIEICWSKFQNVTLTKNQIAIDGSDQVIEGASIKKNAQGTLNKFIGKTVTGVEIGEATMSIGSSADIWIPNSINFIFGAEFLTIYNQLDENGILAER